MAVFTHVTTEQIAQFIKDYPLGTLKRATAIAEGTDNSNYIIETDTDKYILTLFEQRFDTQDVSFYIELMQHLARKDIPCPTPIIANNGKSVQLFEGRPCAIVSFVEGKSIRSFSTEHLSELGTHLAQLHIASGDFPRQRDNDFNMTFCKSLFESVRDTANKIKKNLASEIEEELTWLEENWPTDLPSGMIHADLFPDNVFFQNNHISAVIDFYYACYDAYLYDVAVCLNAWCFERRNDFNLTKAQAFLSAYNHVRPFEEKERQALPVLASATAMRFLLMRLKSWHNHSGEDAIVTLRDPVEYLHRVRFHHGMSQHQLYGI